MTIRNKKYKRSGSILASVMVAAIVWIMIAQSMFITFSGQFKMISSSRTALQAQQYAEIALDKLKNINYDELDASGAHGRKKIEGISSDDWQDEVTIGAESTIAGSDDAKQRIATVNVYKVGDTLPRYTVEVPLSSQSNNMLGMLGMPDYAHMIRQNLGTTYIAPENGYIFTGGSSDDGYFNVYIDDILLCPYSDRYATAYSNVIDSVFIFIPISKGQKYLVKSSGTWGTNVFKVYFVPMMK